MVHAVSRSQKHEECIHSQNPSLHQTQKPKFTRKLNAETNSNQTTKCHLRRAASCGARQRSDRQPLSPRQCVRPAPLPATLCTSKSQKEKTKWRKTTHFPQKRRCHEKLILGWQTFVLMATVLEDSFRFLRVTKIKKKVCGLLEPPPTPATLFTTPCIGVHKKTERDQAPFLTNHDGRNSCIFYTSAVSLYKKQ